MIVHPIPTIEFSKCHPERCDHGICAVVAACPHKAFFQDDPYDFPMHLASRCTGCRICSSACPLRAVHVR